MAACVAVISLWLEPPQRDNGISQKDIVETLNRLGWLSTNPAPAYVPIDLKRPVRLAIGTLGFGGNEQNGAIQDLVLARLTGAPGLELVERQSVESILHELNLSMAGLVRAKDAVRVGKLLKADWFLLGTGAKIAGTNSLVLRIVDTRTGIMRDAGVFSAERPTTEIAADVAVFVRESRKSAAAARPRVFLAIGAFEDLSVNRRQAAFPGQLRSYLTAAYRGTNVTLLEREAVDTLFQETRLDLAGLTEGSETNSPQPMQSAYWLVDGAYQSFETTNFEVELVADVTRAFGRFQRFSFRGKPDADLFAQVKNTIDWQMKTNAAVWPTRYSEARAQLTIGKELANLDSATLLWPESYRQLDAAEGARRQYNTQEAVRAFEAVLLLEPTNRDAKLCLAACLRMQSFRHIEEARSFYRQIIEDPVQDGITGAAQGALRLSFEWSGPDERARWFNAVSCQVTNSPANQFYRQQAEMAEKETILSSAGPRAREIAENELLERMTNSMLGNLCGSLGTEEFAASFGTNQSAAGRRMAELYSEMKAKTPSAVPYLLAGAVAMQVDTNASVVAEFQQLLEAYAEHPDDVAKSERYWCHICQQICEWSFDHKVYRMAATVIENKIRAVAFDPYHMMRVEDGDKMNLAFAYLGLREWRKALEIFETYSNRPVRVDPGPWGKNFSLVFTSKESALCRQKLGIATPPNPLEFDMGKPLLCLSTPSTFVADEKGLWIGIQGQLLHLSFDLETNLIVPLPVNPSTTITTLSLHSSNVWIGTAGGGLIKYDQSTRACRRFTVEDGLALDSIACSQVQGNVLWIGYPRGLGSLDLKTQKFTTFTPPIMGGIETYGPSARDATVRPTVGPPRGEIGEIVVGPPGEIYFTAIISKVNPSFVVNQYRTNVQAWDIIPQMDAVRCLVSDENRLAVGRLVSYSENMPGPIGVSVMNCKNHQWSTFDQIEGLPAISVTALALDRNNLWVGGTGYIALLDATNGTVRKFAYVQTRGADDGVNRIQTGGGYVWAQFNNCLYRVPLSGL